MGYFRRTTARDKIATPSYVTYYLPFVAVILRKEAQIGSLEILTFPFDKPTWALAVAVYFISLLLNLLFVKNRIVKNFQIYQISLGIPVKFVARGAVKRVRFFIMLFYTFILRTVYQCLLFHLFRTHFYEAPPITMEGLIENRYKAICTEISLRYLVDVPHIQNRSLPLSVVYNSNELLPLYHLERNPDKNLVALTNFEFTKFYAVAILGMGNALQLLPISVNEQQIGFYFVKHSYLVDNFNFYILSFQQAGLLDKWKERYSMEYLVSKTSGHETAYEHVLLINLKHLKAFFVLMCSLHLLAAVLFGIEVLSKKFKCLQKLF